jgi:uncharacterized protein YndB with AHSA1/START domain
MPSPDVPIRVEFSVEVDAPPEAVWEAIATSGGLTSWFLPTDMEEREGGALVTHMGETDAPGTITGWDPPRRLVYEEPDWAGLMGHAGADVTPLVSEFLVEARSGGTCVVHVVSSAFGTGADWEQEVIDGMAEGWVPFFEHLRLYLAHFAGDRAITFTVDTKFAAPAERVRAAMRRLLGSAAVGDTVEVDGRSMVVEQVEPAPLVRFDHPLAGFVRCWAWDADAGSAAQVLGYLFGGADQGAVDAERKVWSRLLDSLDAEVTP